MSAARVGLGWDTHRLVEGRPLVIGGVTIDHDRGLEGHSDADVLAHAVADAILGAAALGDIGAHFPDTDPAWAGADSIDLLARCAIKVSEAGFSIVNVDATVIAEEPLMGSFRMEMVEHLAGALKIGVNCVNVKFTRGEGMGYLGRAEGIAVLATSAIEPVGETG